MPVQLWSLLPTHNQGFESPTIPIAATLILMNGNDPTLLYWKENEKVFTDAIEGLPDETVSKICRRMVGALLAETPPELWKRAVKIASDIPLTSKGDSATLASR